jgi:hypothetical protein
MTLPLLYQKERNKRLDTFPFFFSLLMSLAYLFCVAREKMWKPEEVFVLSKARLN